jgi:hypothetical protein
VFPGVWVEEISRAEVEDMVTTCKGGRESESSAASKEAGNEARTAILGSK